MKSYLVCLAALLAPAALGQAMVEHAAAAAGAAIGVGGGKLLSNALDKTLDRAAKTGEVVSAPKKPAALPRGAAKLESPGGALPDAGPIGAAPLRTRKARSSSSVPARPVFAASVDRLAPQVRLEPQLPPAPSADDFAKLKEGDSRQEVLTALGTPSSHVTIPDEGHLIEIMSYQEGPRRIGSVRVDNGQVISITVAAR